MKKLTRIQMMNKDTMSLHEGDFYSQYKLIEPHSVDFVTMDPPFGYLKKVKWDQPIKWSLTEQVLDEIMSPIAQVAIFSNLTMLLEILDCFGEYLELKHFHIAHRSCALPVSQYAPIPNGDFILIFKRKGVKASQLVFNPRETLRSGKPYTKKNHTRDVSIRQERKAAVDENKTGSRFITQVLRSISKPNMKRDERTNHPTQKDLILMRELIRVYSNPGQLILSPFVGSGTDLIAAHMEGRRSIGFELDPVNYQEAAARIKQYQSQGDLFRQDAS